MGELASLLLLLSGTLHAQAQIRRELACDCLRLRLPVYHLFVLRLAILILLRWPHARCPAGNRRSPLYGHAARAVLAAF